LAIKIRYFSKNALFFSLFSENCTLFSGYRPFFRGIFRKTTPFFHRIRKNHEFLIFRRFQDKIT